MRTIIQAIVFSLTIIYAATSFAAGDPSVGKEKASTCLGCHGIPSYTNVYPTYHVPRLGGQYSEYIVAALKAYKTGERGHKTMRAHAAGLNDEDMADIGAYFESLQ